MGTTEAIIEYFIRNRIEYFRIEDIVRDTGLSRAQVSAVIQFWKRYGKIERLALKYAGNRRKYALYRLKTAGKKYINAKAQRLVYAI